MPLALDTSAITHGIQLAVAPVFLLTAVSGMIGVVAGRLARIIDRARVVEERARRDPDSSEQAVQELLTLRRRGYLANAAIALLTACAFIGITIILLFLGETAGLQASRMAVAGFLLGVGSFLLALTCFMTETVLATRLFNFHLLLELEKTKKSTQA